MRFFRKKTPYGKTFLIEFIEYTIFPTTVDVFSAFLIFGWTFFRGRFFLVAHFSVDHFSVDVFPIIHFRRSYNLTRKGRSFAP